MRGGEWLAAAWRRPWVGALALVALVAASYAPVRHAGFIWDDDDYVTENATLRSPDGLRRIWFEPGATPQYYPLTFTTFRLEYALWADDPRGYHLVNVALHLGGALLAWAVLRRLGVPGAWLGAAIFAVHPVHVESVAWVSERKNVLSGVLYLASLLVALECLLPPPSGGGEPAARPGPLVRLATSHPRLAQALSLLLFTGALLSKTVTCSLPAALLLLVWWQQGTLRRRDLLFAAPYFALGLALALMTVSMERDHVGAVGRYWDLDLWQRAAIAGCAVGASLFRLLAPASLSFVYPRWDVDPLPAAMLLAPLAIAALLAATFLLRERIGRAPFVVAALYTGTLFPALGFLNVYPMRYTFTADHYQYLASLAPITLVSAGVASLAAASELAAVVLGAVLVLAPATLAHARTVLFRSADSVWLDVIERHPGVAMAYVNLGMLRLREGRAAEAVPLFERAAALEPEEADVHNDLALAHRDLGDLARARAELEHATRLAPDSFQTLTNLGNVLAAQGRLDEAAARYVRALEIRPTYTDALSNLANVRFQQGSVAAAEELLRRAVAIEPGFADAQRNLGVLLLSTGRPAEAIPPLKAALALRPADADLRRALDDARTAATPRGRSASER